MRLTRPSTVPSSLQNWGYSHKIGPVYLSDREDTISPKKKDEIEDEVRRYVNSHVIRIHCPLGLPFAGAYTAMRHPWEVPRLWLRGQGVRRLTAFYLAPRGPIAY